MLKINHLQKKYQDFSMDCTLEVHSGMITGLIGRNGAGKTTLFKAVMGLISVDGGEITVFGREGGKKMTQEDRKKVGIAYADSGFNSYLTASDCAAVVGAMYDKFNKEEFFGYCSKLSIPEKRKIKDFSTGMKAMLKVITVLASHARLLILDEPTVGLDVIAREQVLDLIRDYMEKNEDSAVVISSHIASDIESLCDDIYMINDGHIVFHEDTDVLLSDYGILKVSESKYAQIDHQYLLKVKKEAYGYCCLTNQKQYYRENYPDIVIENSGIDELMILMNGGR